MSLIRDLAPLIAPHCPAAPVPTVLLALRGAAIEFAERTKCWRDRIQTDIEPCASHELYAPSFAVIHQIEEAWLDGCKLERALFNRFDPDDFDAVESGRGRYITQMDDGSISIIPNVGGRLVMNVILKPPPVGATFDNDTPAIFIYQHSEAMKAGALARLFAIPSQSWTDQGLAERNMMRFEVAMREAANHNVYGRQRTPARARARFV